LLNFLLLAQLFSWRDVYLTLENVLLNHQDSFNCRNSIKSRKETSNTNVTAASRRKDGSLLATNLKIDTNASMEMEKSRDSLTSKDVALPLMTTRERGSKEINMEFDKSESKKTGMFDMGVIKNNLAASDHEMNSVRKRLRSRN
jgi:hypothetical protein